VSIGRQTPRGPGVVVALLALALGCGHARPAPESKETLTSLGRTARRGTYPRYVTGEQSYWTVIGVDGGQDEALMNEEGMVEVGKGRFSLEPFVQVDDRIVTWADVTCEQSLLNGDLPLPVVHWHHEAFDLRVTAFASGEPAADVLWLRYRLTPVPNAVRRLRFLLAVRPLQVLPPWQDLNMVGGLAPVGRVSLDGGLLQVDGRVIATQPVADGLHPLPVPAPPDEPAALHSVALAWPLNPTVGAREIDVVLPLRDGRGLPPLVPGAAARAEHETAAQWRRRLGPVHITLPPAAGDVARTVRSTLAWILVNRDAPALQPGSRNYARSWIRDGALTATALLALGHGDEVRDFLEWYAGFQFPDGAIPCCIDARGADPTPEYDSDGEFVYAVAEYWRFTRDDATLRRLWPHVARAALHIDALRRQRLGAAFAGTAVHGLVPESISHEGYAKQPVHSYWDDFFALRGLADAAELAAVVGDHYRQRDFAAAHAAFAQDLAASIRQVVDEHGLDYVPGSVELADFDPTSTAIAVTVGGAATLLPPVLLARTFTRYHDEVASWQRGEPGRDAYTPYEVRNAEALVRLGRREEAYDVLRFVLAGRRPLGWQQWPEVVWRDPRTPRFIGDMPHGWGGAAVVRTLRTMLAYERAETLMVGAGVPEAWLADPVGVSVRDLPTHWGTLDYRMRRTGPRTIRVDLAGRVRVPRDGIVVAPPLRAALAATRVNGRPVSPRADGTVVVRALPARVDLMEAS
jgi:hypothetical protein